jgi:hypothetical protein
MPYLGNRPGRHFADKTTKWFVLVLIEAFYLKIKNPFTKTCKKIRHLKSIFFEQKVSGFFFFTYRQTQTAENAYIGVRIKKTNQKSHDKVSQKLFVK